MKRERRTSSVESVASSSAAGAPGAPGTSLKLRSRAVTGNQASEIWAWQEGVAADKSQRHAAMNLRELTRMKNKATLIQLFCLLLRGGLRFLQDRAAAVTRNDHCKEALQLIILFRGQGDFIHVQRAFGDELIVLHRAGSLITRIGQSRFAPIRRS